MTCNGRCYADHPGMEHDEAVTRSVSRIVPPGVVMTITHGLGTKEVLVTGLWRGEHIPMTVWILDPSTIHVAHHAPSACKVIVLARQ